MYVGEVTNLDSYLVDNETLNLIENMIWTSGNKRIVEVNGSGIVTAKEVGSAVIYARKEDGLSEVAVVRITVVSMVEGFRLNDSSINIKVGEAYTIPYTFTAVDEQPSVYQEGIEWISANSMVVKVDSNGQLIGLREGTTTIYAVTVDGGKKDDVAVTVSGLMGDIIVDDNLEKVAVYVGGQHAFRASSEGSNVTYGVVWSSSASDVLKISKDGVATGIEAGEAQVKAATKDLNKFDTILVDVVSMVEAVKISQTTVDMTTMGQTVDLEYMLVPAVPGIEPLEGGATWTTSNKDIATVDKNGVVAGKSDGVARITVTSVDGDHEDYCSVTVKVGIEKVSFVEDITMTSPREELFVGEKYELPIVLDPIDATENELKFSFKQGTSKQLKKEESKYYFTPEAVGDNVVKITAESGVVYEYDVVVVSPINGVVYPTDGLVEDDREYLFYVGQKMLLEPIFEMKRKYEGTEVFEKGASWTTEESDVVKIIKENNDLGEEERYLVGTGVGSTTVKVKTKDGGYEDDIDIRVLSSYALLELNDNVTLPINTEVVPEVSVLMRSNLKYELVEGDNFELETMLTIEHQYVKTMVVEDEITLEKEIILDLQRSAVGSDNSAAIYGEMEKHKERLKQLEVVMKTARNGYCEVRDYIGLKDVFGKDYVVAKLDKNKETVTGVRDGKIKLSVTLPGTKVDAEGMYYFSSELKDIIIVNSSGKIIGFNESGFSSELAQGDIEEQLALAVRIDERYGRRLPADTPSTAYIKEIMDLEELNFIPFSLKARYREKVTRLEMAETFVGLIEYVSGQTLKRPMIHRFKDTASLVAELAYDLGIVDVSISTIFDPNGQVTPVVLAKSIDKSIAAVEAFGYSKEKLLLENDISGIPVAFLDIGQVSPSYRVYIEKYANIYNIIEGTDNRLNPTLGLTKEEFLYYVSKLVK